MRDNISPEEKLLRLIRGQKKQELPPQKVLLENQEAKPAVKYSIYSSIQNYLSLNINKIIWVVFSLSCIYLIISFTYPWFGFKKIELPQIPPERIGEEKIPPKMEIKPLESYLGGIGDRQIFGATTSSKTEKPVSSVDADLIKDMTLVGIISGENPQAIIEDKKTQKTYYLNQGQFIGEFKVEEIQEGKIILNYQGQQYELYL